MGDVKKSGSLRESFGFALEGVLYCLRHERNMRLHFCAALLVCLAGTLLRLAVWEWVVCLALFGLVISMEMVNTAIESVVDLATDEYRALAKKAKDVAAGAVFVVSAAAAAIGLIIFLPKIAALF